MRRLLLPACVAAVALVAGCTALGAGSSGATSVEADAQQPRVAGEDTVAPASNGAALKRVDTIELDAERLTFSAGDRLVRVGSMRRAADTVTTLTRLLGTPQKTTTAVGDGGHCLPASTSYTWGGALRVVDLVKRPALGNDLDVRILEPTVLGRSGRQITLQGPDGVAVGEDIADRIGAASAATKEALGWAGAPAWQLVLQQGWSSDAAGVGTNGVSALTDGTTVTVIGSPMPVHASQDC